MPGRRSKRRRRNSTEHFGGDGWGQKDEGHDCCIAAPPPWSAFPHSSSSSSRTPGEPTLVVEGQQEENKHSPGTDHLECQEMDCTTSSPSTPPIKPELPEEILAARTDGSRDSLLLRHFRRRHQAQSGSSRVDSWFSKQVAKPWVALQSPDSTVIPPLDALGSSGPQDEMAQRPSPPREEQQPASFIPDTVVLLSASKVREDMGADHGDSSCAQGSASVAT